MSADPSLPSGLVTFVFTDIEGSTKLFRRLGEAYPPLLEEHNALLRGVWSAHGGAEVKTAGDSFLVAFASAGDALSAAAAAQERATSHRWPTGATVRVRIGVHTGIAFPRGGDYIALAVHQAARVVGAANGGYVLASEDALAAAGDDLSVTTRPIGAFRLRDFEKPAQLFAVAAPGASLATDIPVRAIPAAGHNLVAPPTTFVGRQDAVAHLSSRLAANRLLTIVGPGGMGKTRLATEVGLVVASAWHDGVWMADLTTVSDADGVVSVVADALGVSSEGRNESTAVFEHLESRSAMLILDNCEHLLDPVARFATAVLARCPGIAVLATTREPLAIAGEDIWRIDPLPITEASVRMFDDRAHSISPDLDLAPHQDVIVEICRQLDGMPLAIELAAARVGVLSPPEILAGLKRRFSLLRSRDRTVSDRQRTMQGLLDWSYELLDAPERLAFARLSVFSGSFDLDGARAAVGHGGLSDDDVADLVWVLADKSLANVERTEEGTRYRMLETVRAYAEDRLNDFGDGPATRTALADHYFARFPVDRRGSSPWVNAFIPEADTFGSLIDRLPADGRVDDAYALAGLVAELRLSEQRFGLGRLELTETIERATEQTPSLARLYLRLSEVEMAMGDVGDAQMHLEIAAHLVEERGRDDRLGSLETAGVQAMIAMRGDSIPALRQAEVSLEAAIARADTTASARLHNVAYLAMVRQQLGSLESAWELLDEVSRIARELDDYVLLTLSLSNRAEFSLREGKVTDAARYQREALELAAEFDQPLVFAFGTIIAARIAEPIDLVDAAVMLHAAADRMLNEVEFVLFADDRELSNEMLDRARARVGDERYLELEAEGRALPAEHVISLADEVFNQVAPPG